MPTNLSESELLQRIGSRVPAAGDDCAVMPATDAFWVWTTDMLWREADLPKGVTPYTIGWRAIAVSLSDIAAMGARPLGVLLALGAPAFEADLMDGILEGVLDGCADAGTDYLGGDLSGHSSLTLCSSALGETSNPARRRGAQVGDVIGVTGELGRTAVALDLLAAGHTDRANPLFRFSARIAEGQALAPYVSSMMDISDGLARSLHQLTAASDVGAHISDADVPMMAEIEAKAASEADRRDMALFTGEDFELLFTVPPEVLDQAQRDVPFRVIGEVIEAGLQLDTRHGVVPLEDRGYEHGVG